jgi:hypothetical protein
MNCQSAPRVSAGIYIGKTPVPPGTLSEQIKRPCSISGTQAKLGRKGFVRKYDLGTKRNSR